MPARRVTRLSTSSSGQKDTLLKAEVVGEELEAWCGSTEEDSREPYPRLDEPKWE